MKNSSPSPYIFNTDKNEYEYSDITMNESLLYEIEPSLTNLKENDI